MRTLSRGSARWELSEDRLILQGVQGMVAFTAARPLGQAAQETDLYRVRDLMEGYNLAPSSVVGMEQVHGAAVALAREAGDRVLPGCDGVVTAVANVALTLRSADCLPIVAWDPGRKLLGLAHVGWRGARGRLPVFLLKRLRSLGADPASVCVAIGPGIGPCCYAVGEEFQGWCGSHLKERDGKLFLHLEEAVISQLKEVGVSADQILRSPACTCCRGDLFFSYRREGESAGRMVTCALLL